VIARAAGAVVVIELDLPVSVAVTVSVAVMVWLPVVSAVAEKLPAPPGSGELPGSTALASLLVNLTVPA
jgi:hypothetical protein